MNNNRILEQKRKELQTLEKELRQKENNCSHSWGETKYDPEKVNEPYGFKIEAQGSDIWSVPSGYREVEHPRWSRECKKCGKVEYTKEKAPTKYEPKFN